MGTELERAELRIAELDQRLAEAGERIQMEDEIHAEEHDRLKRLERKSSEMENILGTDADAFGKFMDHALDRDERTGRLKGRA